MKSLPQECLSGSGTRAQDLSTGPRCRQGERTAAVGPGETAANDSQMLSRLARTIEQEIIPRLMLAHRPQAPAPGTEAWGGQPITPPEVQRFARLILADQEELALAEIDAYRARQVPIETLYIHLLAPTARFLGDLWDEDLCSFTDVTVGLGRLQRMLRELSPAFGRGVDHPADGRRVLLLPSPGEQHTFGLVMVGEFFRVAGWQVAGGSWSASGDAVDMVSAEWFDVVGFSLGAEVHLPALGDAIRAVRHAACNPELVILVGGPIFALHPEHVASLGADAMTIDGRLAPVLAERLIVEKLAAGIAAAEGRGVEKGHQRPAQGERQHFGGVGR